MGTHAAHRTPLIVPWHYNGSPLAKSLVCRWKLNEASGTRLDSVGTQNLTDNNTVTSAQGLSEPLAAEFTIANSEYLSQADNATLRTGDIDFWVSAWLRPASVAPTSVIVNKFQTSTNLREWQLYQTAAAMSVTVSPDGTSIGTATVTASAVLAVDTWTFALWYHDSAANVIALSINGGAFAITAHSTGIFQGAAGFAIGRQSGAASYFGGRIGEVNFGKGYIPSQQDALFLYNGSSARK